MKRATITLLAVFFTAAAWAGPDVEKNVKVVVKGGESNGAWLGVNITDLDDDSKEDIDTDAEYGAVVQNVLEDTPAEKAGIEPGDVIVTLDETKIDNSDGLVKTLKKYKPGQNAKLELYRGKEKLTLDVELGARTGISKVVLPGDKTIQITKLMIGGRLGAQVQEMDKDLAEYFRVKEDEGVLVTKVEEDTPAEKAGLKAGDVITAVGEEKVGSEDELDDALEDYKKGDKLELTIVRKGKQQKMTVEMEEKEHIFKFFGDDINAHFKGGRFEWNMDNLKDRQKEIIELKELYNEEIKERVKVETEKSRMKMERELEKFKEELERFGEELEKLKKE
ncbi:PDZ domain-containing protein [candidate division KSB1 bacterium]|nr:PDZ domain-containing protein [candidate division KSB1 bacterium]